MQVHSADDIEDALEQLLVESGDIGSQQIDSYPAWATQITLHLLHHQLQKNLSPKTQTLSILGQGVSVLVEQDDPARLRAILGPAGMLELIQRCVDRKGTAHIKGALPGLLFA